MSEISWEGRIHVACPDCHKPCQVSKWAASLVKTKGWTARCNKCGKDISKKVVQAM